MTQRPDNVAIGSFACSFGDLEGKPESIPGFAELWRADSPGADFAAMGCGTFRKMSRPVEEHVVECVQRTLAQRGTPADEVDHVVFATTDACLAMLGRDFAVRVLETAGLTRCVPVILSFQQCCSSLAALQYGWELFSRPDVAEVVVVSLDFTSGDRDRVRSFALFGDAVTSCLISRTGGSLRLLSSAVNMDFPGLVGQDSFVSRQKVAQASLSAVLGGWPGTLDRVTTIFPTNLYKPVAFFNAAVAGIDKDKLHFTEALHTYGHCGNCDWMVNLADYEERVGLRPGELYLAQASAPGFFACSLLSAT
jgi:3-oxoacyl-[acyl-carrier-protein] synthase III